MTTTLTREAPAEKVIEAHVKADAVMDTQGNDQGIVVAYVSVFANKDLVGDVVVPGAFADDVALFDAGEKSLPVIWSHQANDLDAYIGDVAAMEEDDIGLKVTMQFDLEEPSAAKAYRLLKGGRVKQWSFRYRVVEGAFVETKDDFYYEIRKASIAEVGPTLVGANPDTRTVSMKSAGEAVKAGKTISAKTRAALDAAKAALAAATTEIDALLALDDEPAKSAPVETLSVDIDTKATEAGDAGKAPEVSGPSADERARWAQALNSI